MLDDSHFFQIMEIIILRVYRVRYVIIYVRIIKARYTRNFRQHIKRRQEFKMRWYSAGPVQSTRSVTGDFDPVNLFNTKFSCFTFPFSRPHILVSYEWMCVDSVKKRPTVRYSPAARGSVMIFHSFLFSGNSTHMHKSASGLG